MADVRLKYKLEIQNWETKKNESISNYVPPR